MKSIDPEIRKNMFANPELPLDQCRKIFKNLPTSSDKEKEELLQWLRNGVERFRKNAQKNKDSGSSDSECSKIREHIRVWEQEFDRATIDDLLYLVESTDISLIDVAWERLTPDVLLSILDKYVVGQEEYKKALAVTVYNHVLAQHFPDIELQKQNLLVFGPSGAGKTSTLKILADKLNCDIAIVNCNSIVQEGIIGSNISDALTRTLGNGKRKRYLIIVFDRVDKLFVGSGSFNERIIQEILTYADSRNMISYPTTFGSGAKYEQISSKNITCIFCGKFDSLPVAVRKRLCFSAAGYEESREYYHYSIDKLYSLVTMDDIKKVLGNDEICGRIGQFVSVRQLTANDYIDILLNKDDSVFHRLKQFFSLHDITLSVTDEAVRFIVGYTLKHYSKLGVRGLESVFSQILREDMFRVGQLRGQNLEVTQAFAISRLSPPSSFSNSNKK